MIDLSNTRAIAAGALLAYANESLQAVKHFNAGGEGEFCSYVGPCAIGVNVPEATRVEWDGGKGYGSVSIGVIVGDGKATGDAKALTDLQAAHDTFSQSPQFEETHYNFLIVTMFYSMGLDQ